MGLFGRGWALRYFTDILSFVRNDDEDECEDEKAA